MSRPWQDDDAELRACYAIERTADLAARLGRSLASVYKRAEQLGLSKGRVAPKASNAKPVGSIRRGGRQGYLFVKIAEGGWPAAWAPLHHVNWAAVHGTVPDDCVLTFKDGNVENVDVANLELVKKRDWIMRYHPETTLPPELAGIIRIKAALTRAINHEKAKQDEQTSQ